jgi:hypothetical protein
VYVKYHFWQHDKGTLRIVKHWHSPTMSSTMSSSHVDIEVPASNGASKRHDAARSAMADTDEETEAKPQKQRTTGITSMGLKVLILLAVQNSSKNLLMRFVMKEKPQFLTSAAVIGSGTLLQFMLCI